MRKLMICGLLIAAMGCSRTSERGGGSERRDSFVLKGPSTTATIEAGEVRTVNLTVERGKDFQQTVRLAVEAPTGIAPEIEHKEVRPSESGEVPLKIAVDKNAAPGKHTIHVTAAPEKGNATALDIPVNVKNRAAADTTGDADSAFTLRGPSGATSIRRGEAQTVKIDVERRKGFDGAIKLRAEAPSGLEANLDETTLNAADKKTVNLRITASKNATLGDQSVRVFGNSDKGISHILEVKLNVKE
jgi:uncharacterized membrane protein